MTQNTYNLHGLLVVSRWKSGHLEVDFRHEFVFLHVVSDVESDDGHFEGAK
jgi:hypothetical protein